MKKILTTFLCLTLVHCYSFETSHHRHINQRSVNNSWRYLIDYIINNNQKINLTAGLIYERSYNSSSLATTLFPSNPCAIVGSAVINRDNQAIIADYCGLSNTFQSTVQIKPVMQAWYAHLHNGYQLSDNWLCSAQLSFGSQQCSTNVQEIINPNSQNSNLPAGYMAFNNLETPPAYQRFIESQYDLPQGNYNNSNKNGLLACSIRCAKKLHRTDDSSALLGCIVNTPTQSKARNESLFNPHSGSNHWMIGGFFQGSTILKQNFEHIVAIQGILDALYAIPTKEYRIFDLKNNGFFSRGLLLKEYNQETATNIIRGPMVTHRQCTVSCPFTFDGTLLFTYKNNHITSGIGYNGWIRSTEKISSIEPIKDKKYGIKGLTNLFDTNTNEANNTTQSTSEINTINNLTDQTTVFLTTFDIDPKSVATPLSILHTLCFYCLYQPKNNENTPAFGVTGSIGFEGIEHIETIKQESSVASFTIGLYGSYSW